MKDKDQDAVQTQRKKRHIRLKGSRRLRKEEFWDDAFDQYTYMQPDIRLREPEMIMGTIKGRSL